MNGRRDAFRAAILSIAITLTMSFPANIALASAKSEVAKKALARAFERDAARDAAVEAVPLATTRSVNRFVGRAQAGAALRNGFKPGTHFTSRAALGRPLSAAAAKKRLGLPAKPAVRFTVTLNRGTPVKTGKVFGGAPGVGEMTVAEPIPAGAIESTVPVK